MLKNFIYLNEQALDSYLGALEDGLRSSVEDRKSTSGSVSGGGDLKLARLDGEKAHAEEATTSRTDTPSARFERLQQLARADVDASGWIDIINPDVDLKGLGTGALVELECEIYVPEIVKMLSPSGGLAKAIGQVESLAQLAPAFGSEISGLPAKGQLDAMKGLAGALGGDAMFVGEPNDSDWHVAGKLLDQFLNGEVEGFANVVGKVSTQWASGNWKPLLALPGMNLMPRDKRREMERKGPEAGQEQNWLEGPALMLDVLAIYR